MEGRGDPAFPSVYVIDMKKPEVKKKIGTVEPDRKFKSQGQVINGYFNVFEVTEKYLENAGNVPGIRK